MVIQTELATSTIVERAAQGPWVGFIYREIQTYYSRSSDAPRSPSLARHPLCAGHREALLCGKGVALPRGRGRPSGARESQVVFGYIIPKRVSKIHLGITNTTTTEQHYIIRTMYSAINHTIQIPITKMKDPCSPIGYCFPNQ